MFRLSTYLTLAAACLCLGYAEADVSRVAAAVAGVVILLLAGLFYAEERLPLLSIPAANRAGLMIGLAAMAWLLYQTSRPPGASLAERLAPSRLLPAVGPILLVLMPAKLLRKEKHVGDYWTLHGCALAAVSLAAAMGEDAVTFGIAALYSALAVWSLTLFFVARTSGAVPPVPVEGRPPPAPVEFVAGRAGRSEFARGVLFAAVAAAVAFPLFFLTPRSGAGKMDFGQSRIEVGYAADQMTDLNRTGDLRNNPEVAFEVAAATLDGRPKTDLNPDQRWRGAALSSYTGGAWAHGDARMPSARDALAKLPAAWAPPNVALDRYLLSFAVQTKLRARPLAAPVLWVPGGAPPVATLLPDGAVLPWQSGFDGTFFEQRAVQPVETFRYVQVAGSLGDPDLGTGYELSDERNADSDLRPLTTNPVPAVKEYADRLRDRLIAGGQLPAGAAPRGEVRFVPPGEHHEAIARAFAKHLSESPDFTYTTNLRREKKGLDPVEEFLTVTKSGHCERFASALVLMLRSQGIPAVLVLGFKGAEDVGDGNYVVRQEHAHAWAEAFIPRKPAGGPQVWHWLTLDPTPGGGADAAKTAASGRWWQRNTTGLRAAFSKYILNYTPDQRRAATRAAADWLTRWETLAGLVGVAGVVAGVRRFRRRTRAAVADRPAVAGWFDQLLAVLAAHGYSPAPGETPLEFATATADALRARAGPLADVPLEWVEAYYLARFGGVPLPDDRRTALEKRLAGLKLALAV